MSMKQLSVLGVLGSVACFGLAACNPPHPRAKVVPPLRAISALDCPAEQGDLTLKSAASDGQSCLYNSDAGAQLKVQIVKYVGDPQTALAPLEARLKAELPADTGSATATATDKDAVDINLPGIHIHANDKDRNGAAKVQIGGGALGGVSVNAHDDSAQVAVDARGSGTRRVFILTTDHPGPHGYKVVGYEAAGPVGGPMVVVSAMTKDDDNLHDDMNALLKHNVGG